MADGSASISGAQGRGNLIGGRCWPVKKLVPRVLTEAERAAEEEQRIKYLQKMEQYREQSDRQRELEKHIQDYDPKQRGEYFFRFCHVDLTKFDLDAESTLGPMRFTDAVYKNKDDYELCEGVNIFSLKIASSDVGFPLHVYGSVIARDSLDRKCVSLFRRNKDDCQIINSEDESLILTGPKRGLVLIDDDYVETDLKIKDRQGNDKELSKGMLTIRSLDCRHLHPCKLGRVSLATRLSTVELMYAVVKDAVEGTIAIEVVQGDFDGKIIAHTTNIQNSLLLYDRKVAGAMTGHGNRVIQLLQPVVSVYVKEMLMIVFETGDGKSCTIKFTPRLNGGEEDVITVGATKMRVKVTWSIMDF